MAISLKKGGNVSLEKEDPGIESVIVGLGWDQINQIVTMKSMMTEVSQVQLAYRLIYFQTMD